MQIETDYQTKAASRRKYANLRMRSAVLLFDFIGQDLSVLERLLAEENKEVIMSKIKNLSTKDLNKLKVEEMTAVGLENLKSIIEKKSDVKALDIIRNLYMPNGKALGECTIAELSEMGEWFNSLSFLLPV